MDETEIARAIATLAAKFEGINDRLDDQQGEFRAMRTDVQAIVTATAVQSERMSTHIVTDENTRITTFAKIDEKHDELTKAIAEIMVTSADNNSKLTDLLAFKYRVLGGLAVVGMLIGFFGKVVLDFANHFIHLLGGGH